MIWHSTGFGIEQQGTQILQTEGGIAAQRFVPQIQCAEDVEKIKMPVVTVDRHATAARLAAMQEVFAGILPVKLQGVKHYWFTPWDNLIRWYGVEEAMVDLVERPELVNAAVARVVDACLVELDQMAALDLLELNNDNTRIGSGGYGYTDELPGPTWDGRTIEPQHMWGCSNAQIFVGVSPEMHWEFALRHEMRWLQRWGLTYYGCCEPLDQKLEILRRIPNLRKISMSAWIDPSRAAEAVGTDYVFSYKPSPAVLAEDQWNVEKARLHKVLETVKGCRVEVILKDISTVRGQPQRLWEWEKMAMALVRSMGA